MKPLAKFRIYPDNKALFLRVFVWKTLKDLRAANPGNSHALGLCSAYRRLRVYPKKSKRPDRMLPVIGDIHFCLPWLRAGVIAHELTPALFAWLSERKINPDYSTAMQRMNSGTLHRNSPEERACYAMGEMYRQTCLALTKRKLI